MGFAVIPGSRNVAHIRDNLNILDFTLTDAEMAEFAKKHGLLHVLPLLCNSDFFGIGEIHGQLIRRGTCGNSGACDYLVVGSDNPIAGEYETITDDRGFLVSRKRAPETE